MYNETRDTCVVVAMCCTGLIFVVLGILVRLGVEKKWFALRPIPTVIIPSFGFGLIPVGLGFCASVLIPLWVPDPETAGNLFCWGVTPLWGFGILLVAWQPRWILPRWYRWLKDHYDDIMPQLHEDAQRIGRWEWAAMVRTQEGLEQWARSVRERVDAERQEQREERRARARSGIPRPPAP